MLPFDYCNKTEYLFGNGEIQNIGSHLRQFTQRVLLHYGGGSIRRSGVYDTVTRSLQEAGISWVELGGVKPNPSVELVRTGIELCRRERIDFILAVGGGSVIDSAKGIALGVPHTGDVWKLYTGEETTSTQPLPIAVILTLPAAGSENSPNTVLSDERTARKLGYGSPSLRPLLSLVDPELFLTLPATQMAYGASDMLCHIFERYFTNTHDTELSDALGEATMRTIMQQALRLRDHLADVNAWGQLALCGTLAHNDLLGIGREQSWACHALEHELSALYDVPHGAGLAVLVPTYFDYVWPHNPGIFAQWAANVMGVTPSRDTATMIHEGIRRLRAWYQELNLPQTMQELGIPAEADFDAMAQAACHIYAKRTGEAVLPGICKLQAKDAAAIFRACL